MVDQPVDLDALLRAELAVEPSIEFLPRVRARIDAERPARSRRWLWLAFPAAATIALAVTLPPTAAPPRVPLPPHSVPGLSAPGLRGPAYTTAIREPRKANREPQTPDVIVDERQRDAVLAFIALANSGRLTEEVFRTTTVAPAVIKEQILTIALDDLPVSTIVTGGVLPPDEHK